MVTRPSPAIGTIFRSCARLSAAAVALLGSVAAVARMTAPATWSATAFAAVRIDTALLFVLSGVSLWLAVETDRAPRRVISRLGGLTVGFVGLVVCCWHVVQPVIPPITPAQLIGKNGLIAGRMEAATAFSFLLVGISLLFLDSESRRGHRPAQILTSGAALISLLAVIGHAYGFEPFYRLAGSTPMALHVALTFLLVCAGILSARPDRGLTRMAANDTAGGLLMRWLPAAVFGVPTLFGWLTLSGQRAGYYELEFGISIFVILNTAFFSVLIFWTASALDRADMMRTRAEDELRLRASQQAGVAELSQRALSGVDLPTLTRDTVVLVAERLEAACCEFLEYDVEAQRLFFRASTALEGPAFERATLDTSTDHPYGYALACHDPVVIANVQTDSRFARLEPARLRQLTSGLIVNVRGRLGTSGVLAVLTEASRAYTRDDILFLQTAAAVLATAADRKRADEALRLSEEKFASVFRSCPDPILVSTLVDGRFIDVNESFLRMSGYSRDEVIGQTATDLNFWAEASLPVVLMEEALQTGTLSHREVNFRTRTGEARVCLFAADIIHLDDERCLLATLQDISERKRAEGETQEANEKLARWVSDLESRSRETALINEMGDLLQSCLTPDEAYGIVAQYTQQLFPDDAGALCMINGTSDLLESVASWGGGTEMVFSPNECWALRRGRLHLVSAPETGLICPHLNRMPTTSYMCVPMMAQGEALGVLHLRAITSPADRGLPLPDEAREAHRHLVLTVAEHIALALANLRLRETLRTQSIRDQLTGLFNRRYMEESLERELRRAARTRRQVGIILLDLDRFKAINDTYGHEAGDKVLRAIGQFLQGRTREEDIACRYGGEEFVFVLPEASLDSTRLRAEQLREEVKNVRVQHRGRELPPVSLSLGVAVYPDHGSTASKLLRTSDAALYRAKAEGRDRLVIGIVRSRPAE